MSEEVHQPPGDQAGVNVGFTTAVDLEQSPDINVDDGISMAEFDGQDEPVHARKVSVRKPEIIGLFEFHPMFKEIMQGDDQEKQKVLTDAGKYIDTQISARKIRLDDIKTLFEQLSKDPESPTGKIVENLIAVLESKITDVKNDFEAIKTVSDAVLQFLDTLDIKRDSTSQQEVFRSIRQSRFESNPLQLPDTARNTLDFKQMMIRNHVAPVEEGAGNPPEVVLAGTGTKIFLNFLTDLRTALHGTIRFPNDDLALRTQWEDQSPGDMFTGPVRALHPIVDVTNFYGKTHGFGNGRCSLMPTAGGTGEGVRTPSFLGESEHISGQFDRMEGAQFSALEFRNNFYRGHGRSTGASCAYLAQTITDDLAFSSALGNDAFVNSLDFLGERAAANRRGLTIPDVVTGLDVLAQALYMGIGENVDLTAETGLKGLTAAALYDPDGTDGDKSPIRVFDPGVSSVVDEGVVKKISNTSYDQLLKPILETISEGDTVATGPLKSFIRDVPEKLTRSADVLDQYFAANDPVLNPKAILIKVLTSIRNRIPDLNIGEDVDFSDNNLSPMATGPFIDFALLAAGSRDAGMDTSWELRDLEARHDPAVSYSRLKINDLLTLFLTSIAKTRGAGTYSGLIAEQANDVVNFNTISLKMAKHIRMGLVNTYNSSFYIVDTPDIIARQEGDPARQYNTAIELMEIPDYVEDSENLVFAEGAPGVAPEAFLGQEFSRSRQVENVRTTRWERIQKKLAVDSENKATDALGSGALLRPDSADEDLPGTLMGEVPFGAVRLGGYFNVAPVKPIYGSEIEARLSNAVGLKRHETIFADIIDVVDEICGAATARGPIVDPQTGKMISSGVDPAYIMSFVISMYSLVIGNLLLARFAPRSTYYRAAGDGFDSGDFNQFAKATWDASQDTMVILQVGNAVKSREFISDLNSFLTEDGEIDTLPDGSSRLGQFLAQFSAQVDGSTRLRIDAVDILRTLGDSLSSAGNRYIESFVNDQNQIRVDEQFERIKRVLPLAVARPQVVAMRNQLQNVESKQGFERHFDDFMLSQAQENFFYGSLIGPGQGYQTYPVRYLDPEPSAGVDDGNRVNFTTDRNTKMLTFGIPQGFSKSVLGVDPVLNPLQFAERKVDVYVLVRDHLSGEALKIMPQPYTFDLGLFFDSVSDPVVSSPQTNSQLNEETSAEFLSNFNQSIANRQYPEQLEIFKNNIKMRRILLESDGVQTVTRPEASGYDQAAFDNHTYDLLAKTYIKLTTGMSVTENDFFINSGVEQRLATEPDLRNLATLMNTHISQLLGRDITFNDYLAGDRKFRELLNRLSKGEKTNQIIDEIKGTLEGSSEDANTLTSEDLVAFSRMISSNNPVIAPGLFRDKIISPRLFERVFTIFVNPDKFIALPFPSHPDEASAMRDMSFSFLSQMLDNGNDDPDIVSGIDPQPVVRTRYGEYLATQDDFTDSPLGFVHNQEHPIVNMYQILVVPHKTKVNFFAEEDEG